MIQLYAIRIILLYGACPIIPRFVDRLHTPTDQSVSARVCCEGATFFRAFRRWRSVYRSIFGLYQPLFPALFVPTMFVCKIVVYIQMCIDQYCGSAHCLFIFKSMFYSGSFVLQFISCHYNMDIQEIKIFVCWHINSFEQNTEWTNSTFTAKCFSKFKRLTDYIVPFRHKRTISHLH